MCFVACLVKKETDKKYDYFWTECAFKQKT
jgi:hypothetical protein